MKSEQMQMVIDLYHCTFLPGSFEKRFIKSLFYNIEKKPERELTEKQTRYLNQTYHKYRKQIGQVNHNIYCVLCNDAIARIEGK